MEVRTWPMGGHSVVGRSWLSVSLAVFVCGSSFGLLGCRSQPPADIQAKPSAGPDWQTGKRYFYTEHLSSKLTVAGGGMVAFSMAGGLTLDARQVGGEREFRAHLEQTAFKAEDPQAQSQFDALSSELNQPFGFSTSNGKLSAVRLPQKWSRFAASVARTLAAGFQYVSNAQSKSGAPWTAQEMDATGAYDVEYTPGAGLVFAKRKLHYAPIELGKLSLTGAKATLTPEVIASTGSVMLGDSPSAPRIASVSYTEKLKMQLTPTSVVDSETALRLDYTRSEATPSSPDWEAVLVGTQNLAPDQVTSTPAPPATYDAKRIGDYTFDKALKELEGEAKDPKHNQLIQTVRDEPFAPASLKERENKLQNEGHAFSALAALIRSDSKNVALTVTHVKAKSPAQRALLDALSSAGSPEAQQALASLMNDASLDLPVHRAAAFSLTRTEQATPETVAALQAHVATTDPLHVFALYGLGTIARRLRDAGDTPRATAIVQSLVDALTHAETPDAQVDALRAIANSGGASAFDAVQPFLRADSVHVQAAAVDALRLMVRPEVDGIIAAELGLPNSDVQVSALDAISVREPSKTLATALGQAATSATRPQNRLKAVRIMARWLPQQPELRPTLELLAKSDELDQIRQAAQDALGT